MDEFASRSLCIKGCCRMWETRRNSSQDIALYHPHILLAKLSCVTSSSFSPNFCLVGIIREKMLSFSDCEPSGLVALVGIFPHWTYSTGLAALVGALSHWTYFIHGEHHHRLLLYFGLSVITPLAIVVFETCVSAVPVSTRQAFIDAFMLKLTYLTSLFLSILIYRLYFHPLRHFPGPKTMALSKWGHVFRSRKLDNHHQMDRLRRDYGDFVRTGPSELTVFKPEAYIALHGSQSKCTKAAWYDVLKPNNSMHSTRVKSAHGLQKKAWDVAFGAKGTTRPPSSSDFRVSRRGSPVQYTSSVIKADADESRRKQQLSWNTKTVWPNIPKCCTKNCQRKRDKY